MTENAAFKKAVRKLMAERSIPYAEARRQLLQEQTEQGQKDKEN